MNIENEFEKLEIDTVHGDIVEIRFNRHACLVNEYYLWDNGKLYQGDGCEYDHNLYLVIDRIQEIHGHCWFVINAHYPWRWHGSSRYDYFTFTLIPDASGKDILDILNE